jgi:monoamine oxidase
MDADAIVIGAGAAGLAAARSLAEHSLAVVVVEARDRVGGRVWERPLGSERVPTELGAEFIHGQAPETRALLRDIGARDVPTGGESWTCRDGTLQSPADDFGAAAAIFDAARSLEADESVEQFLARFDDDPAMRDTVKTARAFVEGFDAADPAVASARAIADEWDSGVDSRTARPVGGYAPLFRHLRARCDDAGVEFRLSTLVRRIGWQRAAVSVEVEDAEGNVRTLRAPAAIVTLPVSILRAPDDAAAVRFDPALPAAKRDALEFIEMGLALKVALAFRTRFWSELQNGRFRDAAFFRCEGHPFAAYWTEWPLQSNVIMAWAGGPKALALREISEPALIEHALHGFAALFGEPALARREFDGGLVHDWGRDPFSRGAYSYVAVGGGDARARLAAPVEDTLFFAGEATSLDGQGGTVNGALESGARAALEALRARSAATRAATGN